MADRLVTISDCRQWLASLPENYADAIVTDPPYELGFMGKKWDRTGIAYDPETWAACLRVLKPGGHMLAFGGSRTYHRIACAIEDAGFHIRDTLQWLYGTGFPKSLDVSKAIDKAAGHWRGRAGAVKTENGSMSAPNYERTDKGDPITPEAQHWQGWGTALKPAYEPIVMARKPLAGTVAANVLEHGTGGINVDGCRIGNDDMSAQWDRSWNENTGPMGERYPQSGRKRGKSVPPGRWPANAILDPEAAAMLDLHTSEASRFFYCAKAPKSEREAGLAHFQKATAGELTDRKGGSDGLKSPRAGAGRTSNGRANKHPTVKPIALMRYLCRLVTPPDGLILDPFAGSGTTGCAALLEGFRFEGCEQSAEYAEIAEARIAHWRDAA